MYCTSNVDGFFLSLANEYSFVSTQLKVDYMIQINYKTKCMNI